MEDTADKQVKLQGQLLTEAASKSFLDIVEAAKKEKLAFKDRTEGVIKRLEEKIEECDMCDSGKECGCETDGRNEGLQIAINDLNDVLQQIK